MRLFRKYSDTLSGEAQAIRERRRTSVEIVQECLDRIARCDGQLRAWVAVDDARAVREAERCDRETASGSCRGPLHGIPIGIKDIIDVAGLPTAAGSPRRARIGACAATDAPVVARLRAAGAVILGKTVTTQYAGYDPPPTRNPWNGERTPGGSSSGSAVAVASGMCLAALGSQTGGSITRPAAFCGVSGCKPTFGRVSRTGVVPVATSLDHVGPIGLSVADLAILLSPMVGRDDEDPDTTADPLPDLLADISHRDAEPPLLGVPGGVFDQRLEEAARRPWSQAVQYLADAGARLQPHPFIRADDQLYTTHRCLMAYEAAGYHAGWFAEYPDDYQPGMRQLIQEGLGIAEADYEQSRQYQEEMWGHSPEWFGEADVLICPAAPGAAPDPSTTGDPVFNSPWSLTGLPTICIPCGLTSDGLPVGMQVVGRAMDERRLFRVAAWCEAVLRDQLMQHTCDANHGDEE